MPSIYFEIPDMDQQNYVVQPYIIGDSTYLFIFRNLFRDNNYIYVDIYRDSFTTTNKIYSGLKLTANAVLCLPNINQNFLYGIRCYNIYAFRNPITPQNCSTDFLLEVIPIENEEEDNEEDYITEEE